MITYAKLHLVALTACACLLGARPNASANTLVLDIGPRHSGVGGEFNAASGTLNPAALGYASQTMANMGNGMGFSTFCLEYNEHFTPGGTYNYSISNAAILGGVGGAVNGQDPLSLGTAWLYLNFAQGTLGGYNYTTISSGDASAGYLQNTIWWLEGEIGSAGMGNPFAAAILAQFGSAAAAMADNNGFFGVGVLNLSYLDGTLAQDQLILVPNQNVPDGGTTVILLGLGTLSLIVFQRQLHRRHPAVAAV
jgi:hypothetical protein